MKRPQLRSQRSKSCTSATTSFYLDLMSEPVVKQGGAACTTTHDVRACGGVAFNQHVCCREGWQMLPWQGLVCMCVFVCVSLSVYIKNIFATAESHSSQLQRSIWACTCLLVCVCVCMYVVGMGRFRLSSCYLHLCMQRFRKCLCLCVCVGERESSSEALCHSSTI